MKPAGCWTTLFSKCSITLLFLVLIGFDLQQVLLIQFLLAASEKSPEELPPGCRLIEFFSRTELDA